MASFVKKKDIKELREAGYLAKEIAHRLPAKGQIVPTPEPHEHYKKYANLRPSLLVAERSLFFICDLFVTKTDGQKLAVVN